MRNFLLSVLNKKFKPLKEASFQYQETAILNTNDFGTSYTAGSDTAGSIELVEAEPNRLSTNPLPPKMSLPYFLKSGMEEIPIGP